MDKGNIHVYVGMSGGVDSSVTAALLKREGYKITGVYMKNWTTDLPGFVCPWADDLADAKRVAVQLDIPFKVFDFQKEYKQQVVDYMIREYEAGRTPNPDIMCNQEIKFDLFLRTALEDGADMIATGHYARVLRQPASLLVDQPPQLRQPRVASSGAAPAFLDVPIQKRRGGLGDEARGIADSKSGVVSLVPARQPSQVLAKLKRQGALLSGAIHHLSPSGSTKGDRERALADASLFAGLDKNKDQSYFLYRVTSEALSKTLLPIGELTKPEVREEARKLGLATAEKKDSQGICFVGKIGIKEFLQNYVETTPGDIINKKTGQVIGQHDGAIYYTIGQRQGLHVGGGLPFYVVGKNMDKNEVYVTTDLNDENLWSDELTLAGLHWINDAPSESKTYQVRTRYRAALIDCAVRFDGDELKIKMDNAERALTAGQSAVLYDGDRVVGGGIVV